jgi:hypothetical protein
MKVTLTIITIIALLLFGYIYLPETGKVVEIRWNKENFESPTVVVMKEKNINNDITNFTLVWQVYPIENTGYYTTTTEARTLHDGEIISIVCLECKEQYIETIGYEEIYKVINK